MKGTSKRLLAFFLMLTVLVSLLSVFATAADDDATGEEEAEEVVTMYLNRTFDEGWDTDNGFSWNGAGVPGAGFYVDNETALDYTKNYFARLEFGDRNVSNADHYMSFGLSEFKDYIVMQFKLKVDDAFSYNNRICYSQVKSSTGQNNLLTLNKNDIGVMGEKIADTSYEWVTLTYVFDFTESKYAMTNSTNCQYGSLVCTATDEKGNVIGEVTHSQVWSMNTLRFGNHNKNGCIQGESFCLDDFFVYGTNTGRVLSKEEVQSYGYGSKVSATRPFTVQIDKGESTETDTTNPLEASLGFKVGVEYYLALGTDRAPIFEAENGDVYGAPVVHNGKI